MKTRCAWGCQCERCKGVRQRWHDAVTLPDDILLLPANAMLAIKMEQSICPERRAIHRECISVEDELSQLFRIAERENPEANVIVEEKRIEPIYPPWDDRPYVEVDDLPYPVPFGPPPPPVHDTRNKDSLSVKRFEISLQQIDNLLEDADK